MKRINILYIIVCLLLVTSCYEDYVKDYEFSSVYFASQKPLRTVVADRDMTIKVGVAIGGKRDVDTNDWATFDIDPSLLTGTGLTLLPENYYTLSDPTIFRVSKGSLAVADVTIRFTEAFYQDPNSVNTHYALPFKVKSSSLDKILEGKESSIVAIKYISTYHGTYYVKGKLKELNAIGDVVETKIYADADLSKNLVRNISSLSKQTLVREGIANEAVSVNENLKLTLSTDSHTVSVETLDGSLPITDGSGTFIENGSELSISLKYRYTKDTKQYEVEETLIRRQDPLKDLRFEEW